MAGKKRKFTRLVLPVLLLGLLLVVVGYGVRFARRHEHARDNLRKRPVVEALTLKPGTESVNFSQGSVFFVGNATVIIRFAGFTILTDPNFLHAGDHVHLGYGLQARRLTNPAIEIDALPPIDAVVLSHMHGDHFDPLVKERLSKQLPILTTPEAVGELKEHDFIQPVGLHLWESAVLRKGDATLKVSALPGTHGPGPITAVLPEVHGHLLEFSDPKGETRYRIYISGDTLVHEDLKRIPEQYPDIDLALLHLGGTRVLGLTVTMDGKQGAQALQIIAPHEAIPIHYNDYDRFKSPLSEFQQAVKEAGLADKVRYLKHGETYRFRPKSPSTTQ